MTMNIKFLLDPLHRPKLLLLVCGLLVYSSTLFNEFVGDDNMLFIGNTFYDSPSNMSRIFSKTYNTSGKEVIYGSSPDKGSGSVAYRPVLTLTYFLDRAFWGKNALGYHVDNLVLHLTNVLLAYHLLLKFCDPRLAFVAAVIFCIHPVQSETVSAIGYRADLLACFFVFIAAISWMAFRKGKRRGLWFSAGAYFLALFCKESAILFPVWIIFVDQYLAVKEKNALKPYYFIFAGIAAFYLWVYFFLFPNTTLATELPALASAASGAAGAFSVLVQIWGTYLKFLLVPFLVVPLPGLYAPLPVPLHAPVFLFSLAAVTAACVFLLREVFLRSRAAQAVVWALVFFIPACGLIPNPNPAALRYLYLPGVGIFVLLAAGLIWIWEHRLFIKIPLDIRRLLLLALVLDCAIITFQQNRVWKNNVVMCSFWAKQFPDFYLGNMGIGQEYYRFGMYREAAAAFERAKRDPRCHTYTVPFHLSMSYLKLGFDAKAKTVAENLIREQPFYGGGYFAMGSFYYQNENYKKAKVYFERAILFEGTYNGFLNLMKASYRAGDMSGADRVLARAKDYWGEDSVSFRKLRSVVTVLKSSNRIVFYRQHIISLQPLSWKTIPQDISFLYLTDVLVFP
jgi:hypothetical protein